MNNNLIRLIIIFIVFISGTVLTQGEKNNGFSVDTGETASIEINGNRMILAEAIVKAIENNPDILAGKFDAAMADTYFEKYQTKYSPYLSAGAGVSSTEYPEIMQTAEGRMRAKSYDVSASIIKNFSTGTSVTGGAGYTYSKIKWNEQSTQAMFGMPEKYYNPVLFVSLEQEFLKNAFGYSDRKQIKLLRNMTGMQRNETLYGISLVATGVIADYWSVILYRTLLDNAQLMLSETEKVKNIITVNAKINLVEDYEVNFWKLQIAAAEASVVHSKQQYSDALRKFMQTVNIDEKISLNEKAVLQNTLPELDADEALSKAYVKRVDYLNAMKALENAKLQLDIDSNDALPSLKGSVTVSNNQPEFYSDKKYETNPSYEARINITYPLANTDQQTNERNSRWKIEQAKHQAEKYRRIVKDDVVSKIENIHASFEVYRKAGIEREQAEIYYKSILADMRRGRLPASVVHSALEASVNTKCQELQKLITYNVSLLEFELAKNELFETYGIDVEKYIPKK